MDFGIDLRQNKDEKNFSRRILLTSPDVLQNVAPATLVPRSFSEGERRGARPIPYVNFSLGRSFANRCPKGGDFINRQDFFLISRKTEEEKSQRTNGTWIFPSDRFPPIVRKKMAIFKSRRFWFSIKGNKAEDRSVYLIREDRTTDVSRR